MEKSRDELKEDIAVWLLEDIENDAQKEWERLLKEEPGKYGDGPFRIKKNTAMLEYVLLVCDSVVRLMRETRLEALTENWERIGGEHDKF